MKSNQYIELLLDELNDCVIQRTLKKGELLLAFDVVCDYVGIVHSGVLRMYYIDTLGKDISFSFFLKNDAFTNYKSLLLQEPTNMAIEALTETNVSLIRKEDLFRLYDTSAYWQKVGRFIVDLIYLSAKERIDDLLFLTPEQRYIKLLCEQGDVFQLVPQKYLASYIGVTPQSLSRIRKRITK